VLVVAIEEEKCKGHAEFMLYVNAGEVCHCSSMAVGRQIEEEERRGETMGGNFTYQIGKTWSFYQVVQCTKHEHSVRLSLATQSNTNKLY
jgi:hypothetical protein